MGRFDMTFKSPTAGKLLARTARLFSAGEPIVGFFAIGMGLKDIAKELKRAYPGTKIYYKSKDPTYNEKAADSAYSDLEQFLERWAKDKHDGLKVADACDALGDILTSLCDTMPKLNQLLEVDLDNKEPHLPWARSFADHANTLAKAFVSLQESDVDQSLKDKDKEAWNIFSELSLREALEHANGLVGDPPGALDIGKEEDPSKYFAWASQGLKVSDGGRLEKDPSLSGLRCRMPSSSEIVDPVTAYRKAQLELRFLEKHPGLGDAEKERASRGVAARKLGNVLQSAANFVRISTARIQADDAKQVGDTRNAAATLFAAVTATVSAMNPPPELPALVPPEKSPHEDSEGRPLPLKPGEQQAREAAAGRAVEHVSGKEKEKRKDLEKKVR